GVLGLVVLLGPARISVRTWRFSPGVAWAGGTGVMVLALVFVPLHGSLLAIGALALAGLGWLASRRRAWARARSTSRTVQLVCAELADDLRIGRTPVEAIVAAGARWPSLRPVVIAAQLHHDVPQALHEVARLPGADGLRDVAIAWQVSARAGSGLAESLERVVRLLAARERRARLVDAEMAAARATAMVVCCLPILVLAMGSGLGTHPWSFFLTGLGTGALFLSTTLMLAGWAWLDRLTARESSR
ncbi:MAG: type II secretion system F family protein, partial [Marmoricola sp.]